MSNEEEGDGRTMIGTAPVFFLEPGALVGEYRIERILGEGGMGIVYAGLQPDIGKKVAIKVINKNLQEDPITAQRFVQEARAVNQISHKNIVDIFSFGMLPDGRQYFVMEYLEGRTLRRQLDERRALAYPQVFSILWQMADALEAAHDANVVHRDLKPDNVFLVPTRSGDIVTKLVDFGIAKLMDPGQGQVVAQTQAGVLLGTPLYMSPEQAMGRRVDARADLYALGVIMYEIFTGRVPFYTESYLEALQLHITATPQPPRQLAPMVPELERLILALLEKDPAHRPQNAGVVKVALQTCSQLMCGTMAAPQAPGMGAAQPLRAPPPAPLAQGAPWQSPPMGLPGVQELPTPAASYYASPGRTAPGGMPRSRRPIVITLLTCAAAMAGLIIFLIARNTGAPPAPTAIQTSSPPAPPASHPAALTGTFIVHTNVTNATFYLDDKQVATGTGDATMPDIDPSKAHQIRIEAPGRKPETRTLDVDPGETQEIKVPLSQ
jgi:serine/threonine-protein kinase